MGTVSYTVIDGEIISEVRNGVRRDYVPDPLGSTVALLDGSNNKTDTWEYWPFGEVRSRTGTTATPFQFVGTLGYYRDSSSRTYVRARHYKQSNGRWLTVDPLWPSNEPFMYGEDSPMSFIDRNGLKAKRCYDKLNDPGIKDTDRAKLAKCVVDCIESGTGFARCIAKCLLKLGIKVGKREMIAYLCCIANSTRTEKDKTGTYYVDPCEDTESTNCCNSGFCACLLDRPSGWEGIVDGMCPGKVVLKCQDAAMKDCDQTGYIAPNI